MTEPRFATDPIPGDILKGYDYCRVVLGNDALDVTLHRADVAHTLADTFREVARWLEETSVREADRLDKKAARLMNARRDAGPFGTASHASTTVRICDHDACGAPADSDGAA